MNIHFVTVSISRLGGGLTPAVRRLAQSIASRKNNVIVSALRDKYAQDDAAEWDSLSTKTYSTFGPSAFGYSPELRNCLTASTADIIHRHGLWTYPSHAVAKAARAIRKPYVVSVHGMLNKPALSVSAFRKRVFGFLFENRFLNNAGCIHALSMAEVAACREYGVTSPIAVVPNGIDAPPTDFITDFPWDKDDRKVLLYIGRLHPIKGLPTLLRAFGELSAESKVDDWKLVIAGWEQRDHRQVLDKIVAEFGLESSVHFPGPVYDGRKETALHHCDAFVLPSTSEAHPVAVLEAWVRGKPALLTQACNLPYAEENQMSILATGTVKSMKDGLCRLFRLTDQQRIAMGNRAKQFAQAEFCWEHQAQRMLQVYDWLISGTARPDFVFSHGEMLPK